MKRLLLSLLLVLPLYGFAQKAMQGISVGYGLELMEPLSDYGYSGAISSFSLKYAYNATDRVRILPYFSMAYGGCYRYISGGDMFRAVTNYRMGANVHYVFGEIKRFRPYAIGGLYYTNLTESADGNLDNSWEQSGFGVNFGVGAEYRIAYRFILQVEALMHLDGVDASGGNVLIIPSLTYVF